MTKICCFFWLITYNFAKGCELMAAYKKGKKYYYKGKILLDDGEYKNYNRLAKGATQKKEAAKMEETYLLSFYHNDASTSYSTFEQLAIEYANYDRDIKESTRISKIEIMRIINRELGNKRINLINTNTIQKFIDKLEVNYSVEYVKKIFYNMNPIFEYAINKGYLLRNPLRGVVRRTKRDTIDKEKVFWTPDEFKKFIDYIDDDCYHALFSFLYFMGCRRGELLALKWADLDFQKNQVRINKTVSFKVHPFQLTSPKTKNSLRNISMPKTLFEEMMVYKNKISRLFGFNEDLFVFGYDKPISPETLRQRLKRGIILANNNGENLKEIHIHSFRHSHASYLINNKSDKFTDFDIAKRLGDTVQTLHDTYAHWFHDSEKTIIDLIDGDFN